MISHDEDLVRPVDSLLITRSPICLCTRRPVLTYIPRNANLSYNCLYCYDHHYGPLAIAIRRRGGKAVWGRMESRLINTTRCRIQGVRYGDELD